MQMFDLRDKRGRRRKVIFGETQIDASHGVVLAAMDFEWTCRRAVLALSKKPTVIIRDRFFGDYSSFEGLSKAWKEEVVPSVEGACSLQRLLDEEMSWGWVRDAMLCRNVIVHGTESSVFDRECRWAVCVLENACDVIVAFVEKCGKDIFTRISRPRSKKELEEVSENGKKLLAWRDRVGKLVDRYDESHWVRTGRI